MNVETLRLIFAIFSFIYNIFTNFANMLQGKLDKDSITQSQLWRLALMIDNNFLHVALYPPVAREEIVWRSFPIDPAAPSKLKAIEDIIYDNPLLLAEFRQIDCIIDDDAGLIVPASFNPEHYELLLDSISARTEQTELDIEVTPIAPNATLLSQPNADIAAFLRRTFFNISLRPRLPLIASYLIKHTEGLSEQRAIALMRDGQMTFIAFNGSNLLIANDFKYESPTDAAYYIMASMQQIGLDSSNPDVSVALFGDSLSEPGSLSKVLKPYIAGLCQLPFPTLRFRASKSTIQAPFPLLILPSCE